MTCPQLDERMQGIRLALDRRLEDLRIEAEAVVDSAEKLLRQAVAEQGYLWCEACNGTGAIERLDSGYMRRFGLRPWNGCRKCGGTQETKGCGYVEKTA